MNAFDSFVDSRVDRSAGTLWLALGDVAAILTFVVLGGLQHGTNPLVEPLVVLDTLAPFLVGWSVAGPLLGAYAPKARRSVKGAVVLTTVSWVSAALLGQTLRATEFFHGDAAPAFVAVSIGVGLFLLVPWRVAMAYRRETSESR